MSPLFPSIRRYKYAGKKALFMFETGSIKKEKGGHLAFQKVILYHYGSKYSSSIPTGVAKGCETRCFLAWEPLQ